MESILIQTSQNNVDWSPLATPSTFNLSLTDIDDDSFRSTLTGNLVRKRISPRWVKLEVSYNRVTDEQLNAIARAINTNQKYYVRCKCPAFGNMDSTGSTTGSDKTWVTFKCYTSTYQAEMLPKQVGWTLSFSIIQSDKGNFQ